VKRTILVAIFAVTLHAATFDIAPSSDSRMALTVEKTGLMRGRKHLFVFSKFEGRLEFDATQPEASRVRFEIESASAECKDDWVSMKDLRKIQETAFEDMLAVKRYPRITFVSRSVRGIGPGRFEVPGTLTIRDVSKEVLVTVTLEDKGSGRLQLSGHAPVVLTQFGLKPPSAVLGAIGTKDEMSFAFHLEAILKTK
jgi:polyisoprenoid-binding protein YceI